MKHRKTKLIRCPWATSELDIIYHDNEWGKPVFDDSTLFEFLILEGAQAGLSWSTILKRREGYREVFNQFDPSIVARYSQQRIEKILQDTRVIRNRLKIISAVNNAKVFLKIQENHGSFSNYLWGFVEHQPIINHWRSKQNVPAFTKKSDEISKELKKNGFNFVGSTIIYAFMQAVGLVNDHLVSCFCHPGK